MVRKLVVRWRTAKLLWAMRTFTGPQRSCPVAHSKAPTASDSGTGEGQVGRRTAAAVRRGSPGEGIGDWKSGTIKQASKWHKGTPSPREGTQSPAGTKVGSVQPAQTKVHTRVKGLRCSGNARIVKRLRSSIGKPLESSANPAK